MKSRWQLILASLAVIAVLAWAFVGYGRSRALQIESAVNERKAADALLLERLSGPRYFKAPVAGISRTDGPWINVADAKSQVPLVASERKLGPDKVRDLERLIEQMAEYNPSRSVGGARIKLNALNLALDHF